jgi:hypothetical protein
VLLWVCGAGVVAQELTPWTNSPTPLLALTDQCGIHHTLMAYRGRGCWSTSGLPNVNRAAQRCRPGRALQNKIRQERFVMLAVNYGESSAKGAFAMLLRPGLLHNLIQFVCMLLPLLGDGVRHVCLCLRPSTSLAVENLILRQQLASYQERHVKPRRATHATRLTLT